MDLSSSVRTDSLPAMATLALPGAIALSPWLVWLASFPAVVEQVSAHQGLSIVAVLFSILFVGLVAESAGSYVEVYWIDRQSDDAETRRVNWNAYLRMRVSTGDERIGHRYIRRTLISLKFELNVFVALFSVWVGTAFIGSRGLLGAWTIEALIVVAAVMRLFFCAARDSAEVLASVRATLADEATDLVDKAKAFVATAG